MLGEQAYQNALRRRDDLKREIEERHAEVEQINSFLALCEHFASLGEGMPPLAAALHATMNQPSETTRRKRLTTVSGMALLPHIRKATMEAGRPLQRGAIVRALEERGIRVGGKGKPASNIGTVMWRASKDDGKFIGLKTGYWPRDVACPAVGYEPDREDRPDDDDEPGERIAVYDRHDEAPIGDEPLPRWEHAAKRL